MIGRTRSKSDGGLTDPSEPCVDPVCINRQPHLAISIA